MVSALVVLLMLLMATLAGLYARYVARLSANDVAQAAASAAAHAAETDGWQCEDSPPERSATVAARVAASQVEDLAVQPVAVELHAEACNLIAEVTVAPLGTRISGLTATAIACRSVDRAVGLSVPGSC